MKPGKKFLIMQSYNVLKLSFVIICAGLIFTSCNNNAGKNDTPDDPVRGDTSKMGKYMENMRQLIQKGEYKEALENEIWFHNHVLEYDTNFRGVRLSFALYDWKNLASKYPPAMDSLLNIRDRKTREILQTGESRYLFADVVAINRVLEQNEKSIELFKQLNSQYPSLATQSLPAVYRELLNAKEYELLKKYNTVPMELYMKEEMLYKTILNGMKEMDKNSRPATPQEYAGAADRYVNRVLQLIEYCQAINDNKSAEAIKRKSMEVVQDPRIEKSI
jgi:hypothetical protein